VWIGSPERYCGGEGRDQRHRWRVRIGREEGRVQGGMVRFSAQEEDVDQGGRGKEGQEVGESLELQVRHNHGKMRALASRANMSNVESWGSGSDRTDSDASLTSSSLARPAGGKIGAAVHKGTPAHPAGPPQRCLRRFQIRPRRSRPQQGRNTRPSVKIPRDASSEHPAPLHVQFIAAEPLCFCTPRSSLCFQACHLLFPSPHPTFAPLSSRPQVL